MPAEAKEKKAQKEKRYTMEESTALLTTLNSKMKTTECKFDDLSNPLNRALKDLEGKLEKGNAEDQKLYNDVKKQCEKFYNDALAGLSSGKEFKDAWNDLFEEKKPSETKNTERKDEIKASENKSRFIKSIDDRINISTVSASSAPVQESNSTAHLNLLKEQLKNIQEKHMPDALHQLAKSRENEVLVKDMRGRAEKVIPARILELYKRDDNKHFYQSKKLSEEKEQRARKYGEEIALLHSDLWKLVDSGLTESEKSETETKVAVAADKSNQDPEQIKKRLKEMSMEGEHVYKRDDSDIRLFTSFDGKQFSITPIFPLPSGATFMDAYREALDFYKVVLGSPSVTLNYKDVTKQLVDAKDLENLYKIMMEARQKGLGVHIPANVLRHIATFKPKKDAWGASGWAYEIESLLQQQAAGEAEQKAVEKMKKGLNEIQDELKTAKKEMEERKLVDLDSIKQTIALPQGIVAANRNPMLDKLEEEAFKPIKEGLTKLESLVKKYEGQVAELKQLKEGEAAIFDKYIQQANPQDPKHPYEGEIYKYVSELEKFSGEIKEFHDSIDKNKKTLVDNLKKQTEVKNQRGEVVTQEYRLEKEVEERLRKIQTSMGEQDNLMINIRTLENAAQPKRNA